MNSKDNNWTARTSKDRVRRRIGGELKALLGRKASYEQVLQNILDIKFEHVVPVEPVTVQYGFDPAPGPDLTSEVRYFVIRVFNQDLKTHGYLARWPGGFTRHLENAAFFRFKDEAEKWAARVDSHLQNPTVMILDKAKKIESNFKRATESHLATLSLATWCVIRWNENGKEPKVLHAAIDDYYAWSRCPGEALKLSFDRATALVVKLSQLNQKAGVKMDIAAVPSALLPTRANEQLALSR